MASELTVTKVLLEWINSFSLGKTLRATDELTDGIIVWEVLQDIDPQYFLDEIPERNPSDHWVAKWQNLKHIHKLLLSYIRHQNDDHLPSGLDPSPDLEAVAEKNSVRETNKLLKLLLIAAISSPNAETYVQTLQNLSTPTQEGLKDIIEEAHNGQHEPIDIADEDKEESSKRVKSVDLELQFEERVGKVIAENDRLTHEKKELEKALEDLHNRLARLQENNDTLQNRLASTEDRLVTLKSGKGDLGFNAKALESKSRQQEDLIATQEARLSAAQDELDSLRMTVESLRVKNQRFQKLQDDYDELKTEKDQLARKANAAEKYRQKLQASQDFEKENQALKNQIKDLQQQLKDADSQHRWSSEREVELEEYRKVLPRIEQECTEIQDLKKSLEFNNHALGERLKSAEEQRERDDEIISELRERIRELEGSPGSPSLTPGTETPKLQGTLQKDFEEIGAKESQLYESSSISSLDWTDPWQEIGERRPEKRSRIIEGTLGSCKSGYMKLCQTTTLIMSPLRLLPNLRSSLKLLPRLYSLRKPILPRSMAPFPLAPHFTANMGYSEEYWKLYDNYSTALKKFAEIQDALSTTKKTLDNAYAEGALSLENTNRLYCFPAHTTTAELANKENVDMVHEAKEQNSAELAQMRAEWDERTQRIHHLEAELEASQTLAREACAERDELRGMLDNKQSEMRAEDQETINEMKKLLSEFTAQDGSDSEASGVELARQIAELIDKNIERLAQRAEVSDKTKSLALN